MANTTNKYWDSKKNYKCLGSYSEGSFGLKNFYFQFMAYIRSQLRFCDLTCPNRVSHPESNRPFSYSTKEPGSSVIFIHFYTRGSIEWR